MKTSELTGVALDWAVAKCEKPEWLGNQAEVYVLKAGFHPSTNWEQGGVIVEREKIEIRKGNPLYFPQGNEEGDYYEPLWIAGKQHGKTPLIAAMRCYVASKLGDDVQLLDSLERIEK